MLTDPKITVAIPVHNGARYLAEAIESALGQTYDRTEVIVVNDGSTDKGATETVARRYADRIRYIQQENRGVGGAMNTVLRHMTGDIFTWLSHDDVWLPHKLQSQLAFYNKLAKKNAILFSDYLLINEDGQISHKTNLSKEQYLKTPMLPLLRGAINGCTLFMPARLLQEFGPFKESLRFVQDYDLWNKILRRHEFFLQPEALVKYRIHAGQGTQKPEAALEGDALWIRMVDDRTVNERVQLHGSAKNYFVEMAKFLDKTPYKNAASYAWKRSKAATEETLVSIVLPFSSEVNLAHRAALSALEQTHSRLEVILVRDDSTVDTAPLEALGAADARIRLVRQESKGLAAACNRGMQAARGEYIAFLDFGAEYLPDKIAMQLSAMQDSGSVMSHTSFAVQSAEGRVEVIKSGGFEGIIYPSVIAQCPLAASTVMVHRSVFDGGFRFDTTLDVSAGAVDWAQIALRHEPLGLSRALTYFRAYSATGDLEDQLEKIRTLWAACGTHSELSNGADFSLRDDRAKRKEKQLRQGTYYKELMGLSRELSTKGRHEEAIAVMWRVIHDLHGARVSLGIAYAEAGRLRPAIRAFKLHLASRPSEAGVWYWYSLASCLAADNQFEEADEIFRRNIPIALTNGAETSTAIIRLTRSDEASSGISESKDSDLLQRRKVTIGPERAQRLRDVKVVYFVACDSAYLIECLRPLLRSIELNAGLRCGVHLHVINPTEAAWALIEEMESSICCPLAWSCESFVTTDLPEQVVKTYYSVARFLLLPEVIALYGKKLVIADIDQIVVRELGPLIEKLEEYEVGLLYFPRMKHNFMSSFSASVLIARPSAAASSFFTLVRDYLVDRFIELRGAISWHLDQVALAVAQLKSPQLHWYPIPPQALQSDPYAPDGMPAVRDDALFWSVTLSIPENKQKLSFGPIAKLARRAPKVLFVCFPYSVHAAGWVSLLAGSGWDVHVFPSQTTNALTEAFGGVTFWPVPGLPPPNLAPQIKLASRDEYGAKVTNETELADYLAMVIDREAFDFVHTFEFQHAGYLMLNTLQRLKGSRPKWIATNYGADIMLYGKEPEHEGKIRAVLAGCDYYHSECHRDVDLARSLGFKGRLLLVAPGCGGLDLTEAARLRQPGKTSQRKVIAIKGYQHFAGRALTALKAVELCRGDFGGYQLKIFAPSLEVRAEARRLRERLGLPIDCLPDWLPRKEILKLHGSARMSIAISIADGISTSLLEAMEMGSFPIQTSTACASEWIEDGKGGFIVDPDHPETIADRIERALHDDALVDTAAEINMQRLKEHCDVTLIRERVREAYSEVLSS
jgi:glycosyltransferase involved in cell wall biosynthesis